MLFALNSADTKRICIASQVELVRVEWEMRIDLLGNDYALRCFGEISPWKVGQMKQTPSNPANVLLSASVCQCVPIAIQKKKNKKK